jgi:hypothetical protein
MVDIHHRFLDDLGFLVEPRRLTVTLVENERAPLPLNPRLGTPGTAVVTVTDGLLEAGHRYVIHWYWQRDGEDQLNRTAFTWRPVPATTEPGTSIVWGRRRDLLGNPEVGTSVQLALFSSAFSLTHQTEARELETGIDGIFWTEVPEGSVVRVVTDDGARFVRAFGVLNIDEAAAFSPSTNADNNPAYDAFGMPLADTPHVPTDHQAEQGELSASLVPLVDIRTIDRSPTILYADPPATPPAPPVPPTPPPVSGGPAGTTIRFSYGDAATAHTFDVLAGEALNTIDLAILEVWDGIGAAVLIGTPTDPDAFFDSTDSELDAIASFSKDFFELGPLTVRITIIPGAAASTGQARAQISLTKAGT